MGTQSTGGGSTTSFVNTPQAVDDSYSYSEDSLRNSALYNLATKAVTLDVMSNDLGGNAKSLFSIDDGNGNVLAPDFELLAKDVNAAGCSAWEKTPDGNWIRINSGKIEFKLGNPAAPDDPAQALDLNSLGTNRSVDDEFVYAIRLANGTLSQATVRIHITGQNDAVQMGSVTGATINDTAGNDHFSAITGKLTSTDDDYGDTPAYGISGSSVSDDPAYDVMKATAYGTLYLDTETGDYKFVPNDAAINGLDSDDAPVALNFTVSVTDGDTTDTDTLTITLNGANDTPDLAAVTGATINDTAGNDSFSDITGTLVGSDRDAGETLQYGLTGSSASDDPAFDWMKVTAYGTLYVDKDSGAYKFVANNAAINGLDDDDAAIVLNFGVSVTDGDASDSKTLTITINGANDTPVLAAVSGATINDTAVNDSFSDVTGTLVGSDRDAGETLQYGLTGSSASDDPAFDWMKVTAYGTLYVDKDSGAYKFVANNAAINGLDSGDAAVVLNFGVSVSDGDASDSKTLTITINGANDTPVLTGTAASLPDGTEDNAYTVTKAQLLLGWTDADATDVLSVTGLTASNGTVVANADGSYTITPDANFNGSVTLNYSVSDGTVSVPTSLNYTLLSVNDAPSGADNTVVTLEDTAKTLAVADFGFSDTSDSPANALLSVKITTLPTSGTLTLNGSAVAAGDEVLATDIAAGKLVYTPAPNAVAVATFTFQVRDDGGTANSGVDLDQSPNMLTIDITPVNDAPAGTDTTVVTLEDNAKTLAVADFGFTDPNDTPANALLSVIIATLPTSGTLTLNGSAVIAGDEVLATDIAAGKLVYTPAPNAVADATFTFQVRDDGGTANGGVNLDQSANTLTIDITPVNDAPAGTDNTVVTLEDTAKTFGVADFGFTDPNDSPANALLSVKITTLPTSGTLTLNGLAVAAGDFVLATDIAAGKLVYTPAPNATADATFTFQVRDDGGTANSGVDLDQSPNTLTIDITPVNDAPSGADNTVVTLEDAAKTLAVADFGFTDPNDGPANALLSVKITTLPATGTLTLNGMAVLVGDEVLATDIAAGKLVYTPAPNATADAAFTFQVRDDGGTANGGVDLDQSANTLTIDITPVNDAPAGTDTTVAVTEDTAKILAVGDFGFTDPNDSPGDTLLAVTITTLPASGTLTLNGVAVTAGQSVLASDIAANKLVYTPAPDANGAVTFTFQVQDNGGTTNGGVDLDQSANTLTLNIGAVNDKPVNTMPAGGYSTNEDTAKTLTGLSVADVDAAAGAIKVTLSVGSGTLAASGTASVGVTGSGTGTIQLTGTVTAINAFLAATAPVFTPAANANGNVTLTMTTDDQGNTGSGGAQTDTDSVTISVAAVNDAAVITGTDTGSVTEDAVPNTVTGDLNSTDVDGTDDLWNAQTIASANGYGSLQIGADGKWTYTLDNSNATVNALNTGSPALTDTFTVATADGTTHSVVITINGHTDIVDTQAPTDIKFALNASTVGGFTGNGLAAGSTLGSFTVVDSDSSSWTYALTPTGTVPPAVGISIVGGVVNLVTTGTVATGKYTFTMTVTDPGGNTRVEAYTLSVGGSGGDPATSFTITNADATDPNTGTDISFGLNGGDIINGGGGDDAMVGGNGTDTLNGGLGNDQLFGGQQDDVFVFDTALNATTNVDRILDFQAGGNGNPAADKINLDQSIFSGLALGTLVNGTSFSGTGSAIGTNAQVIYDPTSGALYYDADGTGSGAAVQFAVIDLAGKTGTVDATDFFVIP